MGLPESSTDDVMSSTYLVDDYYLCTSGYSGYICLSCGLWVPDGAHHYCSPTSFQYVTLNERMILALERIAEALEK